MALIVHVVFVVVHVPDAMTAVGALLLAGSVIVTSCVTVRELAPHVGRPSARSCTCQASRRCAPGWPWCWRR